MAISIKALGIGSLTDFFTSVAAYEVVDKGLITYWEWQHQGRRMIFTLGVDITAILLATSVFPCVVYAMYRLVQRRSRASGE